MTEFVSPALAAATAIQFDSCLNGSPSTSINLHGRTIAVSLSRRAQRALTTLSSALHVEMELYFSCMIRKRVRFHSLMEGPTEDREMARLGRHLHVSFRPVVTQHCAIDDLETTTPPVETMPIKNHRAFVPHWLKLDYRGGQWLGEFGFKQHTSIA